MTEDTRKEATTESHKPARPMKYFKDKDGYAEAIYICIVTNKKTSKC